LIAADVIIDSQANFDDTGVGGEYDWFVVDIQRVERIGVFVVIMDMRHDGFVPKIAGPKRVWVERNQTGHTAKQQGSVAGFGAGTGVEFIAGDAIFFPVVVKNTTWDIQPGKAVVGTDPQYVVVVATFDAAGVVVCQAALGVKPLELSAVPIVSGHSLALGGDPDMIESVVVDIADERLVQQRIYLYMIGMVAQVYSE